MPSTVELPRRLHYDALRRATTAQLKLSCYIQCDLDGIAD